MTPGIALACAALITGAESTAPVDIGWRLGRRDLAEWYQNEERLLGRPW